MQGRGIEKKHIITITGDHASGQGTLSNNLQKELGYEIYRNGQYVRKLASEKGMTINEFQVYLNEHPNLDKEIEKSATIYANNHDNLIIDAKLGWYAVPESFKVYLKVDIEVAVDRAFNDAARKNTEPYATKEEAREKILYRHKEETTRWLDTYGVNRDDMTNYDLVLDTTDLTPEEVCNRVIEAYEKWLKN
ncbi:MAG: cytidylate kinase family protein [Clostridia bacterium]|nr:cytidylate kinase family protein [Clostridia bacterium]